MNNLSVNNKFVREFALMKQGNVANQHFPGDCQQEIELIPVIEIEYDNQEIKSLEKYPYWINQNTWQKYRTESLKKAGFEDEFEPYLKGFAFYEPKKISDRNLEKLIADHTEELRKGEYKRSEHSSCFLGGYVLKINGDDKYFPQSCGDLSDITYWEKLSQKEKSYYEGIPTPDCKFWCSHVILDFSVSEFEEHFMPTSTEIRLEVDLKGLKIAIEKAKKELKKLSERVIKINQCMNLGIERIDDLLIWENPNHEKKEIQRVTKLTKRRKFPYVSSVRKLYTPN